MNLEQCILLLGEADAELPARRSLAPPELGRIHATTLAELGRRELPAVDEELRLPVAETLRATAVAVHENFPGNLFADFDALAAHLALGVSSQPDGAAWLQRSQRLLVELHGVFGMRSPIRFRYIHDFLYGYDWAKWVKREPAQRAEIRPFDPEFLAELLERGRELVRSIEAGGTDEYPALDEEDPARNVFSFSRRPDQEERLLQSLSRSDQLPVRGWLAEPGGRWEEGFAGMRLDRAESLGIPTRPGAQA